MNTVHAIVIDPSATGRLAIREVEPPVPASSEALVRVQAISLNAVEVQSIATAQAGWWPGWDLAGVVERAAADGSGPQVGTRVVGIGDPRSGTWAELVAVSSRMLAELPDEVTFAQAATLPAAGLTALFALEKGGFLLNRKVLVTGASGGVGHFLCQLARLAVVHQQRQHYHEAKPLYERALPIYERTLGPEHPDTQNIRRYYAFLLQAMGQDDKARELERGS